MKKNINKKHRRIIYEKNIIILGFYILVLCFMNFNIVYASDITTTYSKKNILDNSETRSDDDMIIDDYIYGEESNVIKYSTEDVINKSFSTNLNQESDILFTQKSYSLSQRVSSYSTMNSVNNIGYITRYSFNDTGEHIPSKDVFYDISITSGTSYLFDQDPGHNGKMKLGKNVIVTLKITTSSGEIVNKTIKDETSTVKYLDLQKLLQEVTKSEVSSISIFIGGTGKAIIYGPYRIYSNTTLKSNYTGVGDNKYVTFTKRSDAGVTFINTDDNHSGKHLYNLDYYEEKDSYRAGNNISFKNFNIDLDDNYNAVGDNTTNVNLIKMIHASNIEISNCEFNANESRSFHNHVIEFSGVSNSKINKCRFIAQNFVDISKSDMDNRYMYNEAIQIESSRWRSNPFCRFSNFFYTDTYTGKKYTENYLHMFNQSQNVSIDSCYFKNVPTCLGDHLGGTNRNYSSYVNISNCDFVNSKVAIHLRSYKNATIQNCKADGNKITQFSTKVTGNNKYKEAPYNVACSVNIN